LVLSLLGDMARIRGEFIEGFYLSDEAHELLLTAGHFDGAAVSRLNRAAVRLHMGEAAEAVTDLRAVLVDTRDDWYGRPAALRHLGEALVMLGEVADAVEPAALAVELSLEAGGKEDVGPSWRVLGTALHAVSGETEVAGRTVDAGYCLSQSLEVLASGPFQVEFAIALDAQGRFTGGETGRSLRFEAATILDRLGCVVPTMAD
jgi:hypothetical protein